jgi:hypothetical protein
MGWLLPTTPDEVAATEKLPPTKRLPPALRDPFAALSGGLPRRTERRSGDGASQIAEALARAAREGKGTITDAVESAMKRDRDAAEAARPAKDHE